MSNFGHIEPMKVIFFLKCSKFYVDFQNAIKIVEKVDAFEDNCVWTCCVSFSQLWKDYMWWPVNLLKGGPKISDPIKRHATELNLSYINGTLA